MFFEISRFKKNELVLKHVSFLSVPAVRSAGSTTAVRGRRLVSLPAAPATAAAPVNAAFDES